MHGYLIVPRYGYKEVDPPDPQKRETGHFVKSKQRRLTKNDVVWTNFARIKNSITC